MAVGQKRYQVGLIDSHDESAREMGLALVQRGFEVALLGYPAEGGGEELSLDGVLIRHRPPLVDAFKFAGVVRSGFGIPIILLGDRPEREVYAGAGGEGIAWDCYVSLPVDYDVLAARLRAVLRRYRRKPQERSG